MMVAEIIQSIKDGCWIFIVEAVYSYQNEPRDLGTASDPSRVEK